MIGDLRHRITLKAATLTPDGAGGFTEIWSEVAAVSAAITPLQGGEQLKFGQIEATTTHQIIIRYRDDITAGMIAVDEDNVSYSIISALAQQGRKKYLALTASARSS